MVGMYKEMNSCSALLDAKNVLRGEVHRMHDGWHLADTCKHNHGKDGKTVRYVRGNRCLFCCYEAKRKSKFKKTQDNSRMVEIDHVIDRRQEEADLW